MSSSGKENGGTASPLLMTAMLLELIVEVSEQADIPSELA